MNIPRNDIKYKIAQKLFDYYVINDKYMAVQMPDGRYVPRRVKCTPLLLFDMLEQGASLGVYQQQYLPLRVRPHEIPIKKIKQN